MVVYEEGGAAQGKGEATIVCGVKGESLPGTLRGGGGAGFAHVRFEVERDEAMLVVAHWRKWDELPVAWAVVSLAGESVAVGTKVADAPDYLRPAVEAAIAKAMCEGCTHGHYWEGDDS